MRDRIGKLLAASPHLMLPLWAVTMSFTTYFCMYAFRKPFSVGTYEGEGFLGGGLEMKTAFIIAQVIGYTISKYAGIKICSEAKRSQWLGYLVVSIVVAEISLLLFAVLPGNLKLFAIFMNGLPLGMVWGFVVCYLEGRRTSEILLAGMSCSFILASGAVKDIGRWLMTSYEISEYWMPFATGALFLVPFALAAFMLDMTPVPNERDEDERVKRRPMTRAERLAFMRRFAFGLSLLMVVYFGLTAFRDFRDNYGVEIFTELGYGETPGIFTQSEFWVAVGVLAILLPIAWIRNNRIALAVVFGLLAAGCALVGGATFLLQSEMISGMTWMILTGLGAYMAYVPFGSVLFDRVVAATRTVGTAVFAIYVADAIGYTGSTTLMLFKDFVQTDSSRLEFFMGYSYVLAIGGVLMLAASYWDFAHHARRAEAEVTAAEHLLDGE